MSITCATGKQRFAPASVPITLVSSKIIPLRSASMRQLLPLASLVCLSLWQSGSLLANGGAWQIGVPATGNAAPSDKNRATDVALEEEQLTIDLHHEFAAVEVRYRMRNTGGGRVVQDFFFPVERWTAEEESEKPADLEGYRITADGGEVKSKNIASPEKLQPVADERWGEFPPAPSNGRSLRFPSRLTPM